MKEKNEDFKIAVTPFWVATQIKMKDDSWFVVLTYAIGWMLVPILTILSKLLKRNVEFGIVEEGKNILIRFKN